MSRAAGLAFLLAAALTAGVKAQPQQPASGMVLSGVIRNAWSRVPLRRATVTLSTSGSEPMDAVTYSDSNGAFAFIGVPPGEYFLCARYRGYDRACFGGTAERGRPLPPLFVREGQNRRDIILAALPLGSITGTVRDIEGDPVPNAQVHMLQPVYERRVLHWRNAEAANTDNRGEFRMPYVRPGRYRFMAERPYLTAPRSQPDVTFGQKPVEELYRPQFYPNAVSIDSAEILTLNAGNDIKAIDFTLAPVERAIVAGRLILPSGIEIKPDTPNSFTPVNLFLIPSLGEMNQAGSSGAAPPGFGFQFGNVIPGSYRLLAVLHIRDRSYFASELVEAGNNTENLSIALNAGSPLAGHLKLVGNGAREHGPYKITLFPGDDGRFMGEQPTADVKDDGSFRFEDVVPGVWDIGVQPQPPGSYLQAMTFGRQDVLTEEMVLQPGPREPLDVTLNMDGAILSGTVIENAADQKPAGRSMVLLAPFGKFDNVLSFYQSTVSDASGHFKFESVTPGRYKIYAFDRMEPNEYQSPDFLKPYVSMGEAFDVPERGRLDRTATLIVRGESGSQ